MTPRSLASLLLDSSRYLVSGPARQQVAQQLRDQPGLASATQREVTRVEHEHFPHRGLPERLKLQISCHHPSRGRLKKLFKGQVWSVLQTSSRCGTSAWPYEGR